MQLNRRQFLGALGATAATAATLPAATPAHAQQSFVPDKDYRAVNPPQPVEAPAGKIEVIEFFWYGCPHCFAFEPTLNPWVQKLPADVAFHRVHAQFPRLPVWTQHAKLFYTLEALGEEARLHKKVFDAIHIEHQGLVEDNEQADWVAKNGIDRAKFVETQKSFGISTKLKRAAQQVQAYQLDGVPTLAVGGKYVTSIVMTQSPVKTLAAMDFLIDAERKKKKV